jgi:hypothetical protein
MSVETGRPFVEMPSGTAVIHDDLILGGVNAYFAD